jgi:O-antigen ligase
VSTPGALGDRPAYWRVAWAEYETNRWLGSGAGTFEQYWQGARPIPADVRDAHSLYLETLAELGPIGLAFLLTALLVPLCAALRARRQQLAPWAAGAYVAFLVHAGLDLDWEMPAVTLAAFFCAAAGLLAARQEGMTSPIAPGIRSSLFGASLVLAMLALVGLLDNRGLI